MKVHPPVDRDRTQKLLHQLERKIPSDRLDVFWGVEGKIRPSAEVHDHTNKRLVHGNIRKTVSPDPRLVPEGFHQRLPERDAGIFHRVVKIHRNVAFRVEVQIKQPVPRKKRQHVIEEWNPGRELGIPPAVHDKSQHDGGFGCLALNF